LGVDTFEEIRGREWSEIWSEQSQNLINTAIVEARQGKVARFTDICAARRASPKWWDVLGSGLTKATR
jgi:hypothetical protein